MSLSATSQPDRNRARRSTAVVALAAFHRCAKIVRASEQEVCSGRAKRYGHRDAAAGLRSRRERRDETRCSEEKVTTPLRCVARKIVASCCGGGGRTALVTQRVGHHEARAGPS